MFWIKVVSAVADHHLPWPTKIDWLTKSGLEWQDFRCLVLSDSYINKLSFYKEKKVSYFDMFLLKYTFVFFTYHCFRRTVTIFVWITQLLENTRTLKIKRNQISLVIVNGRQKKNMKCVYRCYIVAKQLDIRILGCLKLLYELKKSLKYPFTRSTAVGGERAYDLLDVKEAFKSLKAAIHETVSHHLFWSYFQCCCHFCTCIFFTYLCTSAFCVVNTTFLLKYRQEGFHIEEARNRSCVWTNDQCKNYIIGLG